MKGLYSLEELINLGFCLEDLEELVKKNILKKYGNRFLIYDDEALYHYGKELLKSDLRKAYICFSLCYKINPNNTGVCFQLFRDCIVRKDYEGSLKYFANLSSENKGNYRRDANFYLYILSLLIELPKDYVQYVTSLKSNDILVDENDDRYKSSTLNNKFRLSVYNHRFNLAMQQFRELVKMEGNNARNRLIYVLLKQVIDKENKIRLEIVQLIKQKQYEDIINYLEHLKSCSHLSISERYILKLAEDLKDILDTNIIPESIIRPSEFIFDAIDSRNYELALNLCEMHNKEVCLDNETSALYLLLKDIIEAIKVVQKNDCKYDLDKVIDWEFMEKKKLLYQRNNSFLKFTI